MNRHSKSRSWRDLPMSLYATFSLMPIIHALSSQGLCHYSVHGSRASPRTDCDMLKVNNLAVRLGCESKRPEHVEGRMAKYDTVSQGRGKTGDQGLITSNETCPSSYFRGLIETSIPTFTSSGLISFVSRANNFNPPPKSTTPMV